LLEAVALKARCLRKSYRTIGEELHVNATTAHRLVARGLQRLRDECSEVAATVRELDLLGIDEAQSRLIPAIEKGDVASVLAMLRCQERRAKLLGLDAPTETQNRNENRNTNEDVTLYTRQQLEATIKAARDRVATLSAETCNNFAKGDKP